MSTEQPNSQEDNQLNDPFDYKKFSEEWKAGKKPVVDLIMSNYKKPEPTIDPEQEKRIKYAAAMTDTVNSLAEMFAHGQGARIRNDQGPSNTQTTNARLQAIRDKYNNDILHYQSVKGNAEMQDFNQQLQAAMQNRGEKRTYYIRKSEQEAKDKLQAKKDAESKRQFDVRQNETSRHNNAMENKESGTGTKNDPNRTIPIYVNNKQKQFPAKLMDEVIARAVKDGVAGNVRQTIKDVTGTYTTDEQVSPTTRLTEEQKLSIFHSVYPKYVYEGGDGSLLMRKGLSAYDKKNPSATAQEKSTWKTPKTTQSTQSTFQLNGVNSR